MRLEVFAALDVGRAELVAGVQREWWFHRSGCRAWFVAERDTRTNEVKFTELAPTDPSEEPGGEAGVIAANAGGDLQ